MPLVHSAVRRARIFVPGRSPRNNWEFSLMVSVAGSSKFAPTEPEESDSDWWEISSAEAIALIGRIA